MAEKTTSPRKPRAKAKQGTVIQDFRIDIRTVDRSRKDLDKWRQALQSAENILRPVRKTLYDLYEDIVLDDHLTSVMDQRRLAVTTSSIVFQNNGEEVDSIAQIIETEAFEMMLEHILDSRYWGHSLMKCDFAAEACELVPRAHVVPGKTIVVQDPYGDTGIDYTLPPYNSLYLAAGKPKDLGLILKATPLVLIKRGNISDWAQFNEIFGQPTRIGKYDPNMPGQREQMMEALKNAGAMAYLTIPVGAELEMVEANKTGAADTYSVLYKAMEQAISKLIVGQTMTTEDGSSQSQAEVHERVAGRIAKSDRKFVTRILNGPVRDMLIAQGFTQAAQGEFQFVDEEETVTKETRLVMDLSIHNQVGRLKKEYFAQEYNVEFVNDSDEEPENSPSPSKEKGLGDEVKNTVKKETLALPNDFFD